MPTVFSIPSFPSPLIGARQSGATPFGSVACVGLVGYLVGRTKGASIMAGITAGMSAGIMRQLSDVFEGEFFDF